MASVNKAKKLAASILACAIISVNIGLGGCNSGPRLTPEESRNKAAISAAQAGHKGRINTLLSEGVDVNVADSNGETMLHMAAGGGHEELVDHLIAKGASVSSQDAAGNTPLHLAAMNGHPKCATKLLAAGASKLIRNKEGRTPADVASPKVKGLLTP